MMSNEKNKIEALLFAVAKRIHLDEISKITGIRDVDKIKSALNELKLDYDTKGASIILNDEGEGFWKLTVKDHYLPIVNKVVSQTELDKPLMETLAVIAWKYPVLQSDVIKIRHNKAYEHLKILNEMGFISRQRFGRTNKITLTQKFFEYFDLPSKEQAKEIFRNVVPENVKKKIEKTEKEIDDAEKLIEEHNKKKAEEKETKETEKIKEKQETEEKVDITLDKKADTTINETMDMDNEENKESENMIKNQDNETEDENNSIEQLNSLQKKEDQEIKQIESDVQDIEKEEEKDSY